MADTRALPVFGFTEETVQLEDLRGYLNKLGAELDPRGPAALSDNLLEIVDKIHIIGDKEYAEMILFSISSLYMAVPEDRALELVAAFCDRLTAEHFKGAGWGSPASSAVRVLSNLFHGFLKHPAIQQRIFISLLDMCRESRLIGEVDTSLETIKGYFTSWGTDTAGQRSIYRQLHAALLADNRSEQAAKVIIELLGTYTTEDAASPIEDARECVRTAVVDPKSFSFDHICRLSAVQQLEKSDPLMHETLKLFATGTLKDYHAFVAAHPNFVSEKLRVDEAILVKKIRLLTLMSIAEKNQTVPLAVLSSELAIADDEALEEFIIEAIQVNALSGKLNEQTRVLQISSFQHRSFGRDQWIVLQKRIKSLIESVRQSHENIKSVNQTTEVH